MRLLKRRTKPESALARLERADAHMTAPSIIEPAQSATRLFGYHLPAWLVGLALFVLACLPRSVALASFVTVDEAYHWFERADRFRLAVRTGDFAATNLVGHPGVTTMWLGALGLEIQRQLAALGWIDAGDGVLLRALMRLPIALTTALCLALAYPLLVRLLDRRTALLAALLWATEPFLVAHSQLLHVDALLTSFGTLALLAALLAFRFDAAPAKQTYQPRWGYLALSGVCGGLALVTKSPALLLAPMVGLAAIVGSMRYETQDTRHEQSSHVSRLVSRVWPLRSLVFPLMLWVLIVALTWVVVWPAAWVDLPGAISTVLHQAEADGGSPHGWGNYFWGRAVADPGPLFYPVALGFRLAPWTLLGALAGIAVLWRRETRGRAGLALLGVFALLFVAMMTIPPKKFDRYALPIFPALDILAALGLLALADRLTASWSIRIRNQAPRTTRDVTFSVLGAWFSALAWGVVALVLLANLAWFHPYELAYYSQLFGGGAVAQRFIPIGWGEGYEQVGRFLNAQPDSQAKPIATWFGPVLRPFVPGPLGPLTWALTPGRTSYVVLYIDQIQRQDVPEATAQFLGKVAPVYTVHIHGIDYAYVYQAPPAIAHATQASFGSDTRLVGYDLDSRPIGATNGLTLTLNWQTQAAIPEDYLLFAHLLDERGQVIARADVPPGGAGALGNTSSWQADRFVTGQFRIPLAAAPPPGRYWLSLGLYRPSDGQRLALAVDAAPPGAPDDGPNALRMPISLPSEPAPPPAPATPADGPPPP